MSALPASPAARDALDARAAALDAALSRLEAAERAVRGAEAARFEAFAAVFDVAAAGSGSGHRSIPVGRGGEILYRTVRAEAAAALRQSEHTVEYGFSRAHALACSYPRTLDALRDGAISERHTAVIVDAGTVIGHAEDPDAVLRRAGYESAVLAHARLETPSRLRPIARRIAEQYAQVPLDERHAEARRRRRVHLADGDDGMSDLVAHLTAAEAHGMYAELTRRSREIERSQAEHAQTEPRGRDEIRADLLVDVVLGPTPRSTPDAESAVPEQSSAPATQRTDGLGALRARVQLVIPVECLAPPLGAGRSAARGGHEVLDALGQPTAGPAPILTGYGPIDTRTARELAALAPSWELVRVRSGSGTVPGDPTADDFTAAAGAPTAVPGGFTAVPASHTVVPDDFPAVLSVDRYRPSAALRRYLAARDQHCRFPGCRTPLSRCDIDHTVDAALGGATATDNLAHLCRGHHTLKHHGGWQARQRRDGSLEWSSPTGRDYRERPPARVAFARADANAPPTPAAVPF